MAFAQTTESDLTSPHQWGYRSIRALLFAGSLGAALVIVCLNAFYLWQEYLAAIEAEKRDARNLVRSVESQTERIFREKEQFLKGIGDLYLALSEQGFFQEKRFHNYLARQVEDADDIQVLFILNEDGRAMVSARVHPIPENMRNMRAGFFPDSIPETSDFFLGDLRMARSVTQADGFERWTFPIFHAIRTDSGELKGYVAAVLDPNIFNDFVATLEVGEFGDVLIWDGGGKLVASHPNSDLEIGLFSQDIADRMANYRSGGYELVIYTILTDIGDASVVMSTKGVESAQLGIAAYLSSFDYLVSWYDSLYTLLFTTAVILLILFGLAILLDRQLRQKELSEQALTMAREDAEDANKAKSQFLAQVSHEFRTPLNAIIGFSEIIKERIYGDDIGEKYTECADSIHHSGDHLLRIVNDLIDISRAEAGKFTVEIKEVDIGECIEAARKMVLNDAEDHGVSISIETQKQNVLLRVDPHLTEHILINLMSNAIKFSDEGSAVTAEVKDDSKGGICVSVTDTGPGIDPGLVERIGEPFLVERAQVNVPGRGAGLGLSISKRFIELMGGSLSVSSAVGHGTTISLTFPRTLVVT